MQKIESPGKSFISFDEWTVPIYSQGGGPKIICLPPWPHSGVIFFPLFEVLQQDFHLYSFDLPGFDGETVSNQGQNRQYTLTDQIIFTEKVISHIAGDDEYILLGYSHGCFIINELVKRGSINPSKIIYVSGAFDGKDKYKYIRNVNRGYSLAKKMHLSDDLIATFLAKSAIFVMSMNRRYKEHLRTERFKNLMAAKNRLDIGKIVKLQLSALNSSIDFTKSKAYPSLIIYSEKDFSFVKKESIRAGKEFNIKPVVVKDFNHGHLFFRPDLSAIHIKEFLSAS